MKIKISSIYIQIVEPKPGWWNWLMNYLEAYNDFTVCSYTSKKSKEPKSYSLGYDKVGTAILYQGLKNGWVKPQ